jgi:hypothetical protein
LDPQRIKSAAPTNRVFVEVAAKVLFYRLLLAVLIILVLVSLRGTRPRWKMRLVCAAICWALLLSAYVLVFRDDSRLAWC